MNQFLKNCLAFLFVFLLNSLSGQTYLGLSAGYLITIPAGNSSNPHLNSELDYQNSYIASFSYREIHTKNFALGSSISYVHQNAEFHLSSGGLGGDISTDGTVRYGYLDFCFFPEFYFGKKAQFFIDFGPCLGVLLHSDMSGKEEWWLMGNPPNTGSSDLNGSAKEYLNNLTIGFQVKIGFGYAISKNVNFRASFRNGISSVDIDTGGDKTFLTNLLFSAGVDLKISNTTRSRMKWAHE